jgi:hypothetical protein
MTDEVKPGNTQPEVASGYGEADSEAASMEKAARKDELRSQVGASKADPAASKAAAKIPPAEAGPIGHGTSEIDIKRHIAEAARRKSDEASRAKDP